MKRKETVMSGIKRSMLVGFLAAAFCLTYPENASAQYPVAVQPVAPAVVGYTAHRRGVFGRRVVYRPVVAPVAPVVPAAPVVTVARPVVTVARPVVSVARPVVTVARPVVPVVTVAPVAAYYAPPVVRAYRVPVLVGY